MPAARSPAVPLRRSGIHRRRRYQIPGPRISGWSIRRPGRSGWEDPRGSRLRAAEDRCALALASGAQPRSTPPYTGRGGSPPLPLTRLPVTVPLRQVGSVARGTNPDAREHSRGLATEKRAAWHPAGGRESALPLNQGFRCGRDTPNSDTPGLQTLLTCGRLS